MTWIKGERVEKGKKSTAAFEGILNDRLECQPWEFSVPVKIFLDLKKMVCAGVAKTSLIINKTIILLLNFQK